MAEIKIKITLNDDAWSMAADGDNFSIAGGFPSPTAILARIEEMLVEMIEPGTMAADILSRAKPIDPEA